MRRAQIIDGNKIASTIDAQTKATIDRIREETGKIPTLAVVLVGENPASQVYVRNKLLRCRKVGIESREYILPQSVDGERVISLIGELGLDKDVTGILVQLPLPEHLDAKEIVHAIPPEKDVDGFHPTNFGLFMAGSNDTLAPCTPQGCFRLLQEVIDDFNGLDAIVIGCSNIVGKPMAQILLQAGCSVTSVHHLSRGIPKKCMLADIVVVAAGSPQLVKKDWIKPGAVIIDVGINRLSDLGRKAQLVGDVDFDEVSKIARAITPVPGGVGPMTISYLLLNTVRALQIQQSNFFLDASA